jgi:hypothetical protein
MHDPPSAYGASPTACDARRMWNLIMRSATVSEYNRALQKLHAFA